MLCHNLTTFLAESFSKRIVLVNSMRNIPEWLEVKIYNYLSKTFAKFVKHLPKTFKKMSTKIYRNKDPST